MSEEIEELERRYAEYSKQASHPHSKWGEVAQKAKEDLIVAKQEQTEVTESVPQAEHEQGTARS